MHRADEARESLIAGLVVGSEGELIPNSMWSKLTIRPPIVDIKMKADIEFSAETVAALPQSIIEPVVVVPDVAMADSVEKVTPIAAVSPPSLNITPLPTEPIPEEEEQNRDLADVQSHIVGLTQVDRIEAIAPVVIQRDEPSSSSQPSRKRRKRNSDDSARPDMLDVSMIESGPSSQFQSPPPADTLASPLSVAPPSKIFQGLAFYVDLATKNRSDILKELKVSLVQLGLQVILLTIKGAGGTIAVDYADATHVLVSKYQANKSQWNTLVAQHAPKGVWFVYREWAKKSLEEKRRLPEIEHCVPKGELAAMAALAYQRAQSGSGDDEDDVAGGRTTGPVADADRVFSEVYESRARLGLHSERDVAKHLYGKVRTPKQPHLNLTCLYCSTVSTRSGNGKHSTTIGGAETRR